MLIFRILQFTFSLRKITELFQGLKDFRFPDFLKISNTTYKISSLLRTPRGQQQWLHVGQASKDVTARPADTSDSSGGTGFISCCVIFLSITTLLLMIVVR